MRTPVHLHDSTRRQKFIINFQLKLPLSQKNEAKIDKNLNERVARWKKYVNHKIFEGEKRWLRRTLSIITKFFFLKQAIIRMATSRLECLKLSKRSWQRDGGRRCQDFKIYERDIFPENRRNLIPQEQSKVSDILPKKKSKRLMNYFGHHYKKLRKLESTWVLLLKLE